MINTSNKIFKAHYIALIITLFLSCAYYNTLFNAEENYKIATAKLKESKDGQVSRDIRKTYYLTIDKCWKLINIYSDSSKYADDALLLIGKSHYQVEEYTKSTRHLSSFIRRYPKSDLLPEAKLWLARSLIKLENEDEALVHLESIINQDVSNDIAALTYMTRADVYRMKEDYQKAIDNHRQCLDISDDDAISVNALFNIGEIYYELEDFNQAIETFSMIRDYDAPVKLEFDAQIYQVNSYTSMKQYDLAIKKLQSMLRESRYMDYYSQIEAMIGDSYVRQEDYDFAARQYNFVLETYPKTEGSSESAFGLGQLMEYYYQEPDSARKLYLRVQKEFRKSETVEEAMIRARILEGYLKLRKNITRDITDLRKFESGDEVEVEMEMEMEESLDTLSTDTLLTEAMDENLQEQSKISRSLRPRSRTQTRKPQPPKKRTQEEVVKSLEKNQFGLAEYFMLTMQNYDSAEVAYINFIAANQDSILKPKAHHALYYIYSYQWGDSIKADSLEKIILEQYPNSVYADHIREKNGTLITAEEEPNPYHELYLEAESHLFADDFSDALDKYYRIALEDSGSFWAEKSRYAIAWIYEMKLNDVPKAIDAYTAIIKEYPNTDIAKIASNKIKEPPKDIEQGEDEGASEIDSTKIVNDIEQGLENESANSDSTTIINKKTGSTERDNNNPSKNNISPEKKN